MTVSTPSSPRVPEAVDESLDVEFIVPEVYEKYGDMGLEKDSVTWKADLWSVHRSVKWIIFSIK